MSQPKTVILYDWLHHKEGGGERMLFEMLELYPEADLVALTYDAKRYGDRLVGRRVRTSWLNFMPSFLKDRPQWLLPFIRLAVAHLPVGSYDRLISVSSAWVKNVPLKPHQHNDIYCFSPARFLWDSWPHAMNERTKNPLLRFIVTAVASRLRLWDYYESQRSQRRFIAISKTIQKRIKKFYGRDSEVIYPVVEVVTVEPQKKSDYYIVVSVLARYKQIDVAIAACRKLNRSLIIVGEGPDRERLEAAAEGDHKIEFAGRVDEAKKSQLLAQARGFIFCSIEDFGIAPVEALACATPVIALRGGGVSETVPDTTCGVFFDTPTTSEVVAALQKAEATHWKPTVLQAQARKYSRKHFQTAWLDLKHPKASDV